MRRSYAPYTKAISGLRTKKTIYKHIQHKNIGYIGNNLCKQSQQSQQSITQSTSPETLSTYRKYLTTLTKEFTSNHKPILDKLFSIKQNPTSYYNLKLKHSTNTLSSNTTLKIPPFIEIFKHLITQPTISKYFTPPELTTLQNILTSPTAQRADVLGALHLPSNHTIYTQLHNNSELGNKLVESYYKEFNSLNLESKYPSTRFHQLLINGFTSFKILEDIEKNINSVSIGSLEYKGKSYKDILYIFHNSREYAASRINQLSNQVIQRLLFFNEFLQTNKLPQKFIIFLTKQEKEIDDTLEHHQHFRTININTAVTNGRDIIIYREQELLKSVFHELIHFHQLDFRWYPNTHVENTILAYLKKTHNIAENNEYLLYECITETLANILNNIYSRGTKNIYTFQNNLIDEIIFSTFQVSKILKICKYTSWEEFTLLETHKPNPKKHFKQDSCVFSYYILKLYLLLNLNEYCRDILDNYLKFNPTPENFNKLIAIFGKGRTNPILAKFINSLLLNYSSKTKYSKKTKINKTLRMTCIE